MDCMNQTDGQIEKDLQTDRLMKTKLTEIYTLHITHKTYYIQSSLMGRYVMIIKNVYYPAIFLGNKYFD